MSYGEEPGPPGGYGYLPNHGGQPGYGYPPGYGVGGYPAQMYIEPPAYLGWAIGAAIVGALTCWVGTALGLVAVVFGAQVHSKWIAGDLAGAMDSSRKAKGWAIAATVADVLCALIGVGYLVVTLTQSSSY